MWYGCLLLEIWDAEGVEHAVETLFVGWRAADEPKACITELQTKKKQMCHSNTLKQHFIIEISKLK